MFAWVCIFSVRVVEMNEGLNIYSMYNVLILDLGHRRVQLELHKTPPGGTSAEQTSGDEIYHDYNIPFNTCNITIKI